MVVWWNSWYLWILVLSLVRARSVWPSNWIIARISCHTDVIETTLSKAVGENSLPMCNTEKMRYGYCTQFHFVYTLLLSYAAPQEQKLIWCKKAFSLFDGHKSFGAKIVCWEIVERLGKQVDKLSFRLKLNLEMAFLDLWKIQEIEFIRFYWLWMKVKGSLMNWWMHLHHSQFGICLPNQ